MLRKKYTQQRAVFSMKIEYRIEGHDILNPDVQFRIRYKNEEMNNINDEANYTEIKNFCVHVVDEELAKEIQDITDVPVKEVKVIRTYEGSLIIVFSVLFDIYQFVSSISGFYDTIKLVRKTACRHMKKRLGEKFYTDVYDDRQFYVSVDFDGDAECFDEKARHCKLSTHDRMCCDKNRLNEHHPARDAFFWYLLISNIILLILLDILVGSAVIKVYF